MIFIIAGSSHIGKTYLAQKLLEKYKYPYLSVDQLKMGLIRSGQTALTPEDDDKLTTYLWPIVREMIKTAIENAQNLIVEGCYIPFDYKEDFSEEYLADIQYICLIYSKAYIESHYNDIINYRNVIEKRPGMDYPSVETLIEKNEKALVECKKYNCNYFLIDKTYSIDLCMQTFVQNIDTE